jgi:hypothetical protein
MKDWKKVNRATETCGHQTKQCGRKGISEESREGQRRIPQLNSPFTYRFKRLYKPKRTTATARLITEKRWNPKTNAESSREEGHIWMEDSNTVSSFHLGTEQGPMESLAISRATLQKWKMEGRHSKPTWKKWWLVDVPHKNTEGSPLV